MRECLDTSVVVKWFKEGETNENEAEYIRQSIVSFEKEFIINEWVLLEIVRAFVKSGFTKKRIDYAIEYISIYNKIIQIKIILMEKII